MEAGIAVLVPAVTDSTNLDKTLVALERERGSFALDVFVVSRQGVAFDERVRTTFPRIRVISVAAATPIPQMRLAGLQEVQREYVAVIEDHVVVPPGWAGRMLARAREKGGVVAGPVSNGATDSLSSRAAFLCEYSQSLPPQTAGARTSLPGNNTCYQTVELLRYSSLLLAGCWEDVVHRQIRESGGRLYLDPMVEAVHDLPYSAAGYIGDRYHYSRAFAAARLRGASFAIKVLYAAGAVLLPPVLLARILAKALARPQYRADALMSLPLLTLFVVAWAGGEVVGYLAGPGNSLGIRQDINRFYIFFSEHELC